MRDFHRYLLEQLRSVVGCDGATIRPGGRWANSVAHHLDDKVGFTDAYVQQAARYRPEIRRWCTMAHGAAAFVDTELYSRADRDRIALYREVVTPLRVGSIMGCPLVHQGATVAMVLLYRRGTGRPFTADQAAKLTPVLGGIALGVTSALRAWSLSATPLGVASPTRDLAQELSPRHARLLSHLLTGASEKSIAAASGLTPRTVHKYVEQIFRHFGARSRADLMARFLTAGTGAP